MGQHASRSSSRTQRALLRAGLIAAAAGSALAAGGAAGAAAAAPADGAPAAPRTALDKLRELKVGDENRIDASEAAAALTGVAQGLDTTRQTALGPLTALQLNPLARTGSDPLDNSVGTAVGENGAPVSTAAVTGPLAEGASLSELPTAGPLVGGLVG
ncbi:hypothetical protein [Streptomyces sp. 184]|uniref:hypothetical protein n=1 Tax=Streptomyces sp. 184 TaxID=1827526 RepID=UPI00389143DC